MSQRIQKKELKEPLMSNGTNKKSNNRFFKSFLKDRQSLQSKKLESNQETEEQNTKLEPPLAADSQSVYSPTDFASQASDFINKLDVENHLSNFYHQSTSIHEIPALDIKKVKVSKIDPTLFLTITKGSPFFKDINLKEFITFGSYKLLTRIRVRNYVLILQPLTQIDSSLYQEVKTKLYQIKALLKFVGLKKKYKKLYEKLDNDEPILDFDFEEEEKESEEEEKQSQKSYQHDQDKEGNEASNEDVDEKIDSEDEDEDEEKHRAHDDYEQYKGHSEINDDQDQEDPSINYELMAEEEKWEVRAEWLESIIARFEKEEQFKNQIPWISSRLQSLQELDVPFKKLPDQEQDQIFYLFSVLEEEMARDPKREEYLKDKQNYIETDEFYPKVKSENKNLDNDIQLPAIKKKVSLREKLCSRITQRERQTDLFITVYKRKQFGNEKIFEKRINVRGKDFEIEQAKFEQNGSYLFLKLKFNSDEDRVSMLFNLRAQYQDPMFLKSEDKHMFFYDKYYYQLHKHIEKNKIEKEESNGQNAELEEEASEESTPEAENSIDVDSENQEEQAENTESQEENQENSEQDSVIQSQTEEDEYQEISHYEIYEYDFNQPGKVKIYDLSGLDRQENIEEEVVENKNMGRCKEGLYYVREKNNMAGKYHQYEITIKDIKFTTDSNEKYANDVKYCINEAGTKIVFMCWRKGSISIEKYTLDYKSQKLIKDNSDLKMIGDIFNVVKNKVEFKVIKDGPTDFIYMFQPEGSREEVFIFKNEQFWMKVKGQLNQIKPNSNPDRNANQITIWSSQNFGKYNQNNISYEKIVDKESQQKGKKEYKQVKIQHEVINVQQILSYPYLCFIYNHDQVYMKDLTRENKQGYYYMNAYLGISNELRPLTVFCHVYKSNINLIVPTINKKYTPSDFCIRMFQTKTTNRKTELYKFEQRAIFKIWMFNQEIIQKLCPYIDTVGNKTNKLNQDVRIYSKHNALHIERWEENRVQSRIIYTHYHQSNDSQDFFEENLYAEEYQPITYWLLIVQTPGVVQAYTKELDYFFGYEDLDTLESVFEYQDKDVTNAIYSIIVDTLQREKVDLYILFQDGLMKRFTSQNKKDYMLSFEEHPNLYSIKQSSIKSMKVDKDEKRINLYENYKGDIFVANHILYSHFGIIDLDINDMQGTFQIGYLICKYADQLIKEDKNHEILNYSWCQNEAKIGACIKETFKNQFKHQYVVTSMINVRQLPLFHHKRFIHPVVPLIDERKGFTSVLTLTLNRCYPSEDNAYKNHDNQRKRLYNRLHNNNPGFLIKYFNGIEHHLPFTSFGEEFTEIIRFKQSRDGKYAVIVGERKGKLEDRFYISQQIKRELNRGIFLYKIGTTEVKLIQAYLFAEKDPKLISEELKKKLALPVKINKEFVEPELNRRTLGEYGGDYIPNDADCKSFQYKKDIDPKEDDDQYVEMKRNEQYAMIQAKVMEDRKAKQKITRNKLSRRFFDTEEDKENEQTLEDEINALPYAEGEAEIKFLEPKIENLVHFFRDFDIPYIEQDADEWKEIANTELDQRLIMKIENEEIYNEQASPSEEQDSQETESQQNIEPFETEEDKRRACLFSEAEKEKIEKIHINMNIDVNEQGHTFLVNRLNNRLYFFYERNEEPKLIKFRFDRTKFVIKGVDSSYDEVQKKHYLMVWGDKSYKIIDITRPMTKDDAYKQDDLEIVYDTAEDDEVTEEKKKIIGFDEYNYNIKQCFLSGSKVIVHVVHINDNYKTYLKIFDLAGKYVSYYIEGEKFVISGCKNFLWIIEDQNEHVIDIKNDLATFFLWPAPPIENMMFHSLDLFNVCESRVHMITQGFIHLAFDYISYKIHDLLERESKGDFAKALQQKSIKTTLSNNYNYLYYKFSDYRSLIERAYEFEYDKIPKQIVQNGFDQSIILIKEEPTGEDLIKQKQAAEKHISALLNFFQDTFDPTKHNSNHISNFLLTFYQIKKDDITKSKNYLNLIQRLLVTDDKRVNIVEDILFFLIKSQNNHVLQNVINKCFVELMDFADTSVSFQAYLQNITVQTTVMKDTEKFQILASDNGYTVDAYDSPIMDNNFQMKFKKIDQPKIDVEIKYIKLGNLLAQNGKQIMDMLSDPKYLNLMAIPFFQFLVNYHWQNVQRSIIRKLVYPFFLLLALFTLWAVSDFAKFQDIPTETYPEGQQISRLLSLPLLFTIGYFFYIEGKQVMTLGFGEYFGSFINFADLISYSLCLIVVLSDTFAPDITNESGEVVGKSNAFSRPMCSVTLIILWVKLFYYLRVFDSTSKLIRMIIEIVIDMAQFLQILAIGIVAFACGFFVMQQGVVEREQYMADGGDLPDDPWKSFLYSYRLANGDFDYGFFGSFDNRFEQYLAWILWIIGTMFLIIVLLNLLIAIMGDTFGKVLEVITKRIVMEKVKVIAENENLYDRSQLFKSAQYLIIIGQKGFSKGDESINTIKEDVLGIVQTLQGDIYNKIQDNQRELKKFVVEQERAQMKSAAQNQEKMADIFTILGKIQNQLKVQNKTITDMQHHSKNLLDNNESIRADQTKQTQNLYKPLKFSPAQDHSGQEE